MNESEVSLVQKSALKEYSADGGIKKYPSLELVRIEKKFFNNHNNKARLLGVSSFVRSQHCES